jgi:predicted GIY-YIG superfamily endonuclease
MASEHYLESCGCMYTEGTPYPWHICPAHFAKGLRIHDSKKSLQIEFKTTNFILANPQTVDTDIIENVNERSDGQKQHYWLYALKLNDGKYYVGLTGRHNPYYRILAHGGYLGARWTMKHLPLELLEVRDIGVTTQAAAESMEHNLTLAYMQLHGYKNVRGGKVTYTGRVFRMGRYFIRGNQLTKAAFVCVCLLAAGIYVTSGSS